MLSFIPFLPPIGFLLHVYIATGSSAILNLRSSDSHVRYCGYVKRPSPGEGWFQCVSTKARSHSGGSIRGQVLTGRCWRYVGDLTAVQTLATWTLVKRPVAIYCANNSFQIVTLFKFSRHGSSSCCRTLAFQPSSQSDSGNHHLSLHCCICAGNTCAAAVFVR